MTGRWTTATVYRFLLAPGVFGYDRYIGNQLFAFTQATQWDEFLQSYYAAAVVAPVSARDRHPAGAAPVDPDPAALPGMEACLWGVIRFDGAPGAKDARGHANDAGGVRSDSTTLVAGNEADPIYRLRLDGLGIEPGDELPVLTLAYSGTQVQRTLVYDPIAILRHA